ncbi:MAG: hisD [Phycisphaerales bacterium]|nr:hisD [Phycisphaerales bacterium]
MLPTLRLSVPADRTRAAGLLDKLRLKPADVVLSQQQDVAAVTATLADVAKRGDDALVESARRFDDPAFTADQIKVRPDEMAAAHARVPADQLSALRRSIAQVREYQQHILPADPAPLRRPGVELGLRYTPLDSAGCYFPGGKAAYPSSLIMLAVPAQVAGVKRVVVCTPPSKFGKSDLVLAACHELKLTDVYRAGGAAAIAAMAFGTATVPAVDKIVGPGNRYVQLAKRALAGVVGVDGFLGPSEILVLADDSANPAFIAADLIAQAEHDPGSCFLLTDSEALAAAVTAEVSRQAATLGRLAALERSLANDSAILVSRSWDELLEWANAFAAEHVNLQTGNDDAILAKLRHGGAIFVGPYSPVAAGDYVAGPSHCLPTNTTARFGSGISAIEFLKRASVERYTRDGLAADAAAIVTLAKAEGLDGHAASVTARL